ncbi:MAG: NAD(+) kinase [Alkalinema sp. RU_4_3]|nr:NAD(+) kinase [Alkalinema sp. RU_4_3]
MQLKQVIIAYKAGEAFSKKAAAKCARYFEGKGCHILMGPSGAKDNPYPVFLASATQPIDFAIIFGGDGTALAAARQLAPDGVPILAVNIGGHLGFLTEPAEMVEDLDQLWERLTGDRYAVQQRMMLQARVADRDVDRLTNPTDYKEDDDLPYLALNEMCIRPAAADRMITSILEMEVDGAIVDQYQGDGLIVATPTGSTCYTVAANGPIVHPGMAAIIVSPICPLSLSSRAIVLPPGCVISIWPLMDRDLSTKLWMDGVLATALWPGQRIDIRMAPNDAQFILLREDYSYYQTLREKLHWAGARIRYSNEYRN